MAFPYPQSDVIAFPDDRFHSVPMDSTNEVRWGVIGAGDVVNRKSGGPLQDLDGSRWIALYRRRVDAARETAARFGVPRVCTAAAELLNDPDVNAVYVATPPSTHAEYAVAALEAGKNVYLEKPMAMNLAEARRIESAVRGSGRKLVIAHYRRGLEAFRAVGAMLASGRIGEPRFARIQVIQPVPSTAAGNSIVAAAENPWRLRPEISGGGLFHDLAPHQLDLCLDWFGSVATVRGTAGRLEPGSGPDDYVVGHLEFESGMLLDGIWCFAADGPGRSADEFAVYGSDGRISFSFFGEQVTVETGDGIEELTFSLPRWLQEPMLRMTVDHFLGNGENPCPVKYGVRTMEIIDTLARNRVD